MEMVGEKGNNKPFFKQNKGNIAMWSGFIVLVLCCYHLFSDGDFSFLLTFGAFARTFSFGILVFKAFSQKSVAGLSLKTVQLYAISFFFRLSSILRYQGYLPFDSSGDWLYSGIEIVGFLLTLGVLFLTMVQFKSSYDSKLDSFGSWHIPNEIGALYIFGPCLLLGMIFHPNLNMNWFADVAWTISLYVEAIAILPQLYMFQRKGGAVESCISHFVYALAFGSFLQLVFWLFSYHELGEKNAGDHVGYIVILVQLLNMFMMADFVYYYIKSMKSGGPMMLPTHGSAYQA